jgi:hypothetical protein
MARFVSPSSSLGPLRVATSPSALLAAVLKAHLSNSDNSPPRSPSGLLMQARNVVPVAHESEDWYVVDYLK